MNKTEAKLLEAFCQLELGADRAQAHQLGNGEWVCIIAPARRGDDLYYCWDAADWRAYMRANPRKDTEEAKAKKQRKHAREEEVQHAIDYSEAFSLAM